MRRVEVRKYIRGVAGHETSRGTFLTWGVEGAEEGTGYGGSHTVAIVELDDGNVDLVHPCNLTFLKPVSESSKGAE